MCPSTVVVSDVVDYMAHIVVDNCYIRSEKKGLGLLLTAWRCNLVLS